MSGNNRSIGNNGSNGNNATNGINGKKSIKFGIASFAHMHAYSYLNCLENNPRSEIVAVAEENEYSQKILPDRISKKIEYLTSYEKLTKHPDVDVILITSETKFHKDIAISAFENGKDVIVEKPIAISLEDANSMIGASKRYNRKLIQCYPCRYHPTSQSIKTLIDEGKVGEIYSISATNHGQMPPHEGETKWFSEKGLAGGGALMDHITHVADLNFWFSGQNIKSVFAKKKNLFHENIDIDDAGIVYLTYDGGMKSTLDPSWSRPKNFETWGDVTMTIFGSKMTLTFDMFAQFSRLHSDGLTHPIQLNHGSDMDYLMLDDFINNLINDSEPMLMGEDGLKALEVAIMAYESAEKNEIVTK